MHYSPLISKADATQLLHTYNCIPIAKLYSLNFDTSLSVFLKTESEFLLESAESGESMGRYSFIAKGICRRFEIHNTEITETLLDSQSKYTSSQSYTTTQAQMDNPMLYIQSEMKQYKVPKDEIYRYPPFWGGLIGYLGYETIGYYEDIENLYQKEGLDIPDGVLIIPQSLFVIDHLTRSLWIIGLIDDIAQYENEIAKIDTFWEAIKKALPEDYAHYNECTNTEPNESETIDLKVESSFTKDEYEDTLRYCKECIYKGDIIQVVLSRRVEVKFDSQKSLLFYIRLRNVNPSPYMYYLNFGNFVLVGSSPEVMASLNTQGDMMLRPIAGTIRRGRTRKEDLANQTALLSDEKEIAEHIMLVDLGRNDLHRIAKPNTVKLTKYMQLESYSHVFHIVSTVEGKIQDGLDAFDLIKASFPAGTLSGAPKIEAMNIIGRLEKYKRKVYGGLVMVLGLNAYFDSCIAIRTGIIKDDTIYLQAGGGIVADSVPEHEWRETELKLGAMIDSLKYVEKT